MADVHEMKRNDLRPYFRVTLTQTLPDKTTPPVDLTNATSASFSMKPMAGGTAKVSKQAMTFIDRANGIVQYQWKNTDTDTSGAFTAEVEVLWGTEPQSWPSSGYFSVSITDDVA